MTIVRRSASTGVVLSLVGMGLLWGCGGNGASNNDQGVSVSLLGFYSDVTAALPNQVGNGQCATPGTPVNRLAFRIGSVTESSNTATANTNLASAVSVLFGVQNNLSGQFFRADRMVLDYYIPGSNAQPPSTNIPLSVLAGPAPTNPVNGGQAGVPGQIGIPGQGGQGTTGNNSELGGSLRRPANSALPPSYSSVCNQIFSQASVVPSAIREWISFHRSELPEPPFSMEVYVTVAGLTSSGDRLETNTTGLGVDVLPEVIIVPTEVSDSAPSAASVGAEVDTTATLGETGNGSTL